MRLYDNRCFEATAFCVSDRMRRSLHTRLNWYSDEDGMLMLCGEKVDHETFVRILFEKAFLWMIDDVIDENATILWERGEQNRIKLSMHNIKAKPYKYRLINDITNDRSVGALLFPMYMISLEMCYNMMIRNTVVFVDPSRRARIRKHADEGMRYCNGKTDYDLRHYGRRLHDEVTSEYSIQYLTWILCSVFRSIHRLSTYSNDVICRFSDGWVYIGKLVSFYYLYSTLVRYRIARKVDSILAELCMTDHKLRIYVPLTLSLYDDIMLRYHNGEKMQTINIPTSISLLAAMVRLLNTRYIVCAPQEAFIFNGDSITFDISKINKTYKHYPAITMSLAIKIGCDITLMTKEDIKELEQSLVLHVEEEYA